MKQLRAALGVIFGFWLLLGVSGALYWFVGEWNARRQLPPELRTPEAIHKLYDDAVCLEYSLGGGMILVMSLVFGAGVLFIWVLIEVVNSFVSERGRGRESFSENAPPNNGMHPTANSAALIENLSLATLNARRVMPGVRCYWLMSRH